MRRYMHGGVNITGFQLIDLQSKHLEDFMKDWGGADLGRTYPGVVPDKLTVVVLWICFVYWVESMKYWV
ncbi:hypothetical protein DPMN_060456 [Dreissena polymorpha]|uniref:Uncharacterized protein n=1 Tax=Dreissena polymorpha TaxID=45954 RepID=A0A9D4C5V1_DREPO|nr:hypothetical protein DPMN_060456 [Dreissena polymorpha]